jgi:hypothetical protein
MGGLAPRRFSISSSVLGLGTLAVRMPIARRVRFFTFAFDARSRRKGRTVRQPGDPVTAPAQTPAFARWSRTAALAVIGAAVSLLISGAVPVEGTSFFHLQVLAGLWRDPQFADDHFVQSMRYYASGFWFPLSGRFGGEEVYPLLVTFNVLSRILFFIGALECATVLRVETPRQRLIFTLLVALAASMRGLSRAGQGGLFTAAFGHSEVANGTTLLMLAYAARGRVALALAMNGVTFFLSAFIAVWNAAPLALILGMQLRNGALGWKTLARRGAIGLALAAIFALPVLRNVVANPDYGRPIDFSYVSALLDIWPYHFLIWVQPPSSVIWLAMVTAAAFLAAAKMRPGSDFLIAALIGFSAIWLFGAVLPWLSQSPLLLNLHLLRSSSSIQICATLAFAALATLWLTNRTDDKETFLGCVVALLLSVSNYGPPLLLLVLIAASFISVPRALLTLPYRAATVTAIVVLFALAVLETERRNQGAVLDRSEWESLGRWARTNTAADAIFLIPISMLDQQYAFGHGFPKVDPAALPLIPGFEVFPYFAHRRIWITDLNGNSVMWNQHLYPLWKQRMAETLALQSLDQRLDYASSQGIAYVVDGCDSKTEVPLWKSRRLCVYRAPDGGHSAAPG